MTERVESADPSPAIKADTGMDETEIIRRALDAYIETHPTAKPAAIKKSSRKK